MIRKGANTANLSSTTCKYTYDANGNITEIRNASNVIQYKYTYDNLGQLTREDNRPLNKTYVYSYDLAGNITEKTEYAFTTDSLGSIINTVTYTYGDASSNVADIVYGVWTPNPYTIVYHYNLPGATDNTRSVTDRKSVV